LVNILPLFFSVSYVIRKRKSTSVYACTVLWLPVGLRKHFGACRRTEAAAAAASMQQQQ
jgi:hypothetical protein